ncbi:MAG: GGDEF domain-containing protein [Thermodesulfovibrionales bacterium]
MNAKSLFNIRFSLLRGVLVISVAAVVIVPVYVVLFVAPSFRDLLTKDTENDAVRIATHLADIFQRQGTELTKETLPDDFSAEADAIRRNFGLMKMKVFSPSGETIYSTNPEDVGQINREKYFRDVVAKGRSYSKIAKKNTKSLEGQVVTADVVETYVPILKDTTFLGAFEIYLDITSSSAGLDKLIAGSYAVLSVIMLVLLAAVMTAGLKAARTIEDRRKKEMEIIGLYDIMYTILDKAPFGVYLVKRNGDIEYVNQAMLNISGAAEEQFVALNVFALDSYKKIGLADEIRRVFDNRSFSMKAVKYESHFGKKTSIRNFSGMPLMAEGGDIKALLFVEDITEQKNAEEQIRLQSEELARKNSELAVLYEKTKALSLKDPLTGLANRRLMDIVLQRNFLKVKRYGGFFSVLMIDIDHFKKYNDTHGHSAGDKLLAGVAGTISENVRDSDLVVRYGGEEFLVSLPETDAAGAYAPAERIRKGVEEETGATVSLGIASLESEMQHIEDLIKKADGALYLAKKNGRNRVETAR